MKLNKIYSIYYMPYNEKQRQMTYNYRKRIGFMKWYKPKNIMVYKRWLREFNLADGLFI
jgi:hypothetical protein